MQHKILEFYKPYSLLISCRILLVFTALRHTLFTFRSTTWRDCMQPVNPMVSGASFGTKNWGGIPAKCSHEFVFVCIGDEAICSPLIASVLLIRKDAAQRLKSPLDGSNSNLKIKLKLIFSPFNSYFCLSVLQYFPFPCCLKLKLLILKQS